MVYQCPTVHPFVRPFHMPRFNLRTPWPIHFKFHIVIGINGLMVCILYGEISNFHFRVMGLYSSNCRGFFICHAVNWEPLANSLQTSHSYWNWWSILFGEISIFHSRVVGLYSSNCRRFFVCHSVNWEPLCQFTSNFVQWLELIVFTDFSKAVGEI